MGFCEKRHTKQPFSLCRSTSLSLFLSLFPPLARAPHVLGRFSAVTCGHPLPGSLLTPPISLSLCLSLSPHLTPLSLSSQTGFLNNVMIGAAHAINTYPQTIKKVAIFDFDGANCSRPTAVSRVLSLSLRVVSLRFRWRFRCVCFVLYLSRSFGSLSLL